MSLPITEGPRGAASSDVLVRFQDGWSQRIVTSDGLIERATAAHDRENEQLRKKAAAAPGAARPPPGGVEVLTAAQQEEHIRKSISHDESVLRGVPLHEGDDSQSGDADGQHGVSGVPSKLYQRLEQLMSTSISMEATARADARMSSAGRDRLGSIFGWGLRSEDGKVSRRPTEVLSSGKMSRANSVVAGGSVAGGLSRHGSLAPGSFSRKASRSMPLRRSQSAAEVKKEPREGPDASKDDLDRSTPLDEGPDPAAPTQNGDGGAIHLTPERSREIPPGDVRKTPRIDHDDGVREVEDSIGTSTASNSRGHSRSPSPRASRSKRVPTIHICGSEAVDGDTSVSVLLPSAFQGSPRGDEEPHHPTPVTPGNAVVALHRVHKAQERQQATQKLMMEHMRQQRRARQERGLSVKSPGSFVGSPTGGVSFVGTSQIDASEIPNFSFVSGGEAEAALRQSQFLQSTPSIPQPVGGGTSARTMSPSAVRSPSFIDIPVPGATSDHQHGSEVGLSARGKTSSAGYSGVPASNASTEVPSSIAIVTFPDIDDCRNIGNSKVARRLQAVLAGDRRKPRVVADDLSRPVDQAGDHRHHHATSALLGEGEDGIPGGPLTATPEESEEEEEDEEDAVSPPPLPPADWDEANPVEMGGAPRTGTTESAGLGPRELSHTVPREPSELVGATSSTPEPQPQKPVEQQPALQTQRPVEEDAESDEEGDGDSIDERDDEEVDDWQGGKPRESSLENTLFGHVRNFRGAKREMLMDRVKFKNDKPPPGWDPELGRVNIPASQLLQEGPTSFVTDRGLPLTTTQRILPRSGTTTTMPMIRKLQRRIQNATNSLVEEASTVLMSESDKLNSRGGAFNRRKAMGLGRPGSGDVDLDAIVTDLDQLETHFVRVQLEDDLDGYQRMVMANRQHAHSMAVKAEHERVMRDGSGHDANRSDAAKQGSRGDVVALRRMLQQREARLEARLEAANEREQNRKQQAARKGKFHHRFDSGQTNRGTSSRYGNQSMIQESEPTTIATAAKSATSSGIPSRSTVTIGGKSFVYNELFRSAASVSNKNGPTSTRGGPPAMANRR